LQVHLPIAGGHISAEDAIKAIFDTDKLIFPHYQNTYLVALKVLQLHDNLGLSNRTVQTEMEKVFRRQGVSYVHLFGTDRFWRGNHSMKRLSYPPQDLEQPLPPVQAPIPAHMPPSSTTASASLQRQEASTSISGQRQRIPWSEEEVISLVAGVLRHRKGKWKQIREDPDLRFHPCRTNVDLKDKYRAVTERNSDGMEGFDHLQRRGKEFLASLSVNLI
jgi:hypothetical protein